MNSSSLQSLFTQIQNHLQKEDILKFSNLEKSQKNSIEKDIKKFFSKNVSSEKRKRILDEFFHTGPLEPLIKDLEITEILVNSHENIWFEKQGRLQKHEDTFFSHLTYENFIRKMCQEANIFTSFQNPTAQGKWNHFRLHIMAPPVHKDHTVFSLRRHPQNPWTFSKLFSKNWAPQTAFDFLKESLQQKKSFLIVGPTGCGKTSVLNACLQEVSERTVIIEDTCELHCPNPLSLKFLTREVFQEKNLKSFSQKDLLKESLRMRPDRIVMGEIRSEEAKDFLLSLSSGHTGAFATLHAKTAKEALWRLEILIQMGAPHWTLQTIRSLIHFGLDYILVLTSKRTLSGVYEITALEPRAGFLLEEKKFH